MEISKFQKEVLKELVDLAIAGKTITYGDLSVRMGKSRRSPRYLSQVLGNISRYTYNELGIFISVIVLNEDSMNPGEGFVQFAESILNANLKGTGFIQKQMKNVFAIRPEALKRLRLVEAY